MIAHCCDKYDRKVGEALIYFVGFELLPIDAVNLRLLDPKLQVQEDFLSCFYKRYPVNAYIYFPLRWAQPKILMSLSV